MENGEFSHMDSDCRGINLRGNLICMFRRCTLAWWFVFLENTTQRNMRMLSHPCLKFNGPVIEALSFISSFRDWGRWHSSHCPVGSLAHMCKSTHTLYHTVWPHMHDTIIPFRQTAHTKHTYCLREGPGSLVVPARDNKIQHSVFEAEHWS